MNNAANSRAQIPNEGDGLSPQYRNDAIEKLRKTNFDVLVVGGGIEPNSGKRLTVAGDAEVLGTFSVDSANDNSGATIKFNGSSTRRNFRIANQEGFDRCFEITRSTTNGGTTWDGTPALLIRDDQRVAIATSAFQGNDPEDNTLRTYTLNINGDVNFNGT